ncbi:MAG: amino acid adenylation domain-containing protein [Tatlockia sp.]|nr:amino acid adenylation domain-containing protein [Tatlockia sp.]
MTPVFNRILNSFTKYPEKIAIIDNDRTYTYQELNEFSDKISRYLTEYKIGQNSKVAFLMRRSYCQLATILAIWKLGATYIPFDPKTPRDRINRLFNNIDAACLVCDSALLNNVSFQNKPILTLNDPEFIALGINKPFQYREAQIAYMIYTSGSTGEPKGVMITHQNLTNHINWLIQDFEFSEVDCFSFNSSMAFDFSVANTILPLAVGATISITSEVDTLDIATYCQQLKENKVTFAKWTPSYFRLLIDYLKDQPIDLSSFRFIMVAGEELLTSYAESWFKIYPSHTLINEYGPTETAVGITTHTFTKDTINKHLTSVPIGKPAINSTFYVVDSQNNCLIEGEVGELLIGGLSVGIGYYNQPQLTSERFINNPFDKLPERLYRTGDLVKKLADGSYLYLGRIDNQVKVNGYRIELNEIEHCILQNSQIKEAKLIVNKEIENNPKIYAYLVLNKHSSIQTDTLKATLSRQLPAFMIPHQFFRVSYIPMNSNGKADFTALKQMTQMQVQKNEEHSHTTIGKVRALITKFSSITSPENHSSFFNLGLSSLSLGQFVNELNQQCQCEIKIQDLFAYSCIASLASHIDAQLEKNSTLGSSSNLKINNLKMESIAVIAMDCRLPQANNCEELWDLCKNGLESIAQFAPEESSLNKAIEKLVYARGVIQDLEYFDADFFGFSARDAHLTDPQVRLLIESAWVAFEKAGYIPEQAGRKTGVFVSSNDSTYLLNHNLVERLKSEYGDRFALQRLMSPQCLATKIAYNLNCTGPSITVQTACSGSLVAVVLACQQLSNHQCDVALAGGVSLVTPQNEPYSYQRENIFSPDGHCRPFDAHAQGTVFSNGLGTIVLKRLKDALRDNDTIISVIKGANTNNDGSHKMSFTAPSVQGQAKCILAAQESAGICAKDIQYIETHGTGTLLGDPIEIEALSNAFRQTSKENQFCALGSLKANIGHTHVAAGVAGLIKTSLALSHRQIPPSINCETPNPSIDWENTPFYVNKRLQNWPQTKRPRNAAVSAFGVGGTNAHVILEEGPLMRKTSKARKPCMLLLSAKSPQALSEMQNNLIEYLEKNTDKTSNLLANIAYTLQVGRKQFDYRTGIVCNTVSEATARLKENHRSNFFPSNHSDNKVRIVFLFPGQGTQYVNLAKELYEKEPIYRQHLDICLKIASAYFDSDLKKILFSKEQDNEQIKRTEYTHPLLFSVEYALAQLLIAWGINPDYMLGHSLGEYVVACLSNVFSLDDAIKLVCARGKAIARCAKGAMLAAPLSKSEASVYCNNSIYLAAINEEKQCVFSGSQEAIKKLKLQLTVDKPEIASMLIELENAHPFHSVLLEPALKDLSLVLKSVHHKNPTIPYLSNLTGDWVNDKPQDSYWLDHMLNTVQFSRCIEHFASIPNTVFIEVGPGQTLLSLIAKHKTNSIAAINLLPNIKQLKLYSPSILITNALKTLWCQGIDINWDNYYKNEKRQRLPLPTYPFEKKRYWFDEIIKNKDLKSVTTSSVPKLYVPTWIREPIPLADIHLDFKEKNIIWIVFDNESILSRHTLATLQSQQSPVWIIKKGDSYAQNQNQVFINPKDKTHYEMLIKNILKTGVERYAIIHFWPMNQSKASSELLNDSCLYHTLFSGLFLAQAFYKKKDVSISCLMVTNQLQKVLGTETIIPLTSSVLSLCRVLSLENKNCRFNNIDIDYKLPLTSLTIYAKHILKNVLTSLNEPNSKEENQIAYRHNYSWKPSFQTLKFSENKSEQVLIQKKNTYLITGGLGAMGLTIAEWIATKVPTTLVLLSRTSFPLEKDWEPWLAKHHDEDSISQTIQKLKKIVDMRTKVVTVSCDIVNFKQTKLILKQIHKEHGEIKGIFHLAGIAGEGLALLKETTTLQAILAPKVQGTWILCKLFKQKPLDFFISASSLTAIAGGIGQLDYCAANLFLDYFFSKKQLPFCKQVLTINWNSWSSIGMATKLGRSKSHEKLYSENSISPQEAMSLLESVTRSGQSQVIISRNEPNLERERIINAFNHTGKKECSFPDKSELLPNGQLEIIQYIWKAVLGITAIYPKETFYSLGGDSLLAIELLTQLDKQLNIELSLQEFTHITNFDSLLKLIELKPLSTPNLIVNLSLQNPNSMNDLAVYFIHPLGGTVFNYISLKPYLSHPANYYAIQDPEIAKDEVLFNSISDMAKRYSTEIALNQPKGPIVLIGASYGGNIAMEMVSFLSMSGFSIQKVILIDSWANLGQAISQQEAPHLDSLAQMKKYYGTQSHQYQRINTRLSWLRTYSPTTVSNEVIVLAAKELLPFYKKINEKANGWTAYCSKPILEYKIDGNHDTMFHSNYLVNLGMRLVSILQSKANKGEGLNQ